MHKTGTDGAKSLMIGDETLVHSDSQLTLQYQSTNINKEKEEDERAAERLRTALGNHEHSLGRGMCHGHTNNSNEKHQHAATPIDQSNHSKCKNATVMEKFSHTNTLSKCTVLQTLYRFQYEVITEKVLQKVHAFGCLSRFLPVIEGDWNLACFWFFLRNAAMGTCQRMMNLFASCLPWQFN